MLSAKGGNTKRTIRRAAAIAAPLGFILLLAALYSVFTTYVRTTSFYATWSAPLKWACVLIGLLAAVYAVRVVVHTLNDLLDERLGRARGRSIATITSIVLYSVAILTAINLAGFDLSGLLLGGAFTGVVLGIAGQTSLSNIIAGLVILLARPYSVGMFLTARAGSFGGVEYSGQVWDISLFYTTLKIAEREVRIPNSAMIAAVVVQRPRREEITIPITIPHAAATDVPAWLDRLRRGVTKAASDAKPPIVTIDAVNEIGYVVSLRAMVADPRERRAVESVVARLTAPGVLGQADPDAAAEQEKLKLHQKEWSPHHRPSGPKQRDRAGSAEASPVPASSSSGQARATHLRTRVARFAAYLSSRRPPAKAQNAAFLSDLIAPPALRSVIRSNPYFRVAYTTMLYDLCKHYLPPKEQSSWVRHIPVLTKLFSLYAVVAAKWRSARIKRSR